MKGSGVDEKPGMGNWRALDQPTQVLLQRLYGEDCLRRLSKMQRWLREPWSAQDDRKYFDGENNKLSQRWRRQSSRWIAEHGAEPEIYE